MLENFVLNLLKTTEPSPETGKLITILTEGDAALYALIGFLVTFIGIVIIIGVIWVAGLIIRKSLAKQKSVADMQEQYAAAHTEPSGQGDEIGEAERVAIIAAIAAYYESENSVVSEFKVRRIKRL